MAQAGPTFTLAEVARRLEVPQHRLIHLCEKQVVVPDIKDAGGRGSSRVFSARNFLELAVALRLRDMMIPVAVTGAIIHVIRGLEDRLHAERPAFSLVESLRDPEPLDFRVIISDGDRIFFTLGRGGTRPALLGGVSIEDVVGNADVDWDRLNPPATPADDKFGGPEGSSFSRSEISLTAIAQSLPLG